METVSLQFIPVAGFVVSIVLCIAAFFLFLSLRGLYTAAQRVLRLRSSHREDRSMDGTGCCG